MCRWGFVGAKFFFMHLAADMHVERENMRPPRNNISVCYETHLAIERTG